MKTPPPYHANGATYFTNEHGERICTGSQMGRRSIIPDDYNGERLHLRRVPLYDGAYDRGGAYWGIGFHALYCAWGYTATEAVEVYMRADNRADAKARIASLLPAQPCFFR